MTLLRMTLSAVQSKQLADELAALSKQQSKALEKAVFFVMSRDEGERYDQRLARIQEIRRIVEVKLT